MHHLALRNVSIHIKLNELVSLPMDISNMKTILHFLKQLRCLDKNNHFGLPSTEKFENYTILKPCFIYIAC